GRVARTVRLASCEECRPELVGVPLSKISDSQIGRKMPPEYRHLAVVPGGVAVLVGRPQRCGPQAVPLVEPVDQQRLAGGGEPWPLSSGLLGFLASGVTAFAPSAPLAVLRLGASNRPGSV